ncbi:hypothetical protein [Eubacterium ramulus]
MAVEIITGHIGKEHVTAEAAGALHVGIIGSGKYVLTGGNQFAAEIVSNNLIKIKSGELVNQGRHMRIPVNSYEEVTIQNGAQGMHRSDLIVMRYKKDTSLQVESAELVVIKGKASSSIQTSVPSYVNGNILSGATQDDFPLYRVSLNGLTVESVTPLFNVLVPMAEMQKQMPQCSTAGVMFDSWISDAGDTNGFVYGNVAVINFAFGSNNGSISWTDIGLCNLLDASSGLLNAAATASGVLVDQQTGKCIDCYIYAGQNRVYVNSRGNKVSNGSWLRGTLVFRV